MHNDTDDVRGESVANATETETDREASASSSTSTVDSLEWRCPNCLMMRCFKFNYCEQVRVQWEAQKSRS